jgi:flavin reductase (DIM6/NTAB) family NADH-FMN oxidoreductase RutF
MADRQPTEFDELVADLDAAMLIVTTTAGGERAGCLVGFATQCSIDPPLFIVCVSKRNRTFDVARRARAIAVHVPARDDIELAELFGGETGDEIDKFERCKWSEGPRGLPILDGVASWFTASVVTEHDAGDHQAFLVEPEEVRRDGDLEPLRLHAAMRIDPGHEA